MVAVTFPDGALREYPKNTSGLDIAKGISPSLAKRTVAMALDGKLADLSDPITHDAKVEFLTRDDPRALELIRHDAAHVLAEAVQTLWPGTQVTIGPVIDNGFYYDFFRNQPFTPEDFEAIERPAVRQANLPEFFGGFGEGDIEDTLAAANAFEEELEGKGGFAGAWIAFDEVEVAGRKAAVEDVIEAGDAGVEASGRGLAVIGGNRGRRGHLVRPGC